MFQFLTFFKLCNLKNNLLNLSHPQNLSKYSSRSCHTLPSRTFLSIYLSIQFNTKWKWWDSVIERRRFLGSTPLLPSTEIFIKFVWVFWEKISKPSLKIFLPFKKICTPLHPWYETLIKLLFFNLLFISNKQALTFALFNIPLNHLLYSEWRKKEIFYRKIKEEQGSLTEWNRSFSLQHADIAIYLIDFLLLE